MLIRIRFWEGRWWWIHLFLVDDKLHFFQIFRFFGLYFNCVLMSCDISEAATIGVLWKKVFLEMSQNSWENNCARASFNKAAGFRPASLLKKIFWHRCFLVKFAIFLRTPFYKTSQHDCFWHLWFWSVK